MEEELNKIKKVGNWLSAILLGNTRELIARIDERTEIMKKDLENIKPKVDDMFPKVDILWKDRIAPATSPRELNPKGQEILEKSGIKQIIDDKKSELLELVKQKNPKNAYDAENAILLVMATDFKEKYPELIEQLKTGAFNVGAGIDELLFVGGIYLRNLIFDDLGFKLRELNGIKPERK